MPDGLKWAVLGLITLITAFLFGSRAGAGDSSLRVHGKAFTQRVTSVIYPPGGTDPPGN